jgi:hypothetical protein
MLKFVIGILFVICYLSFGIPALAGVAGQFYPADKNELSRAIDGYLKPYKVIRGEGDLLAIIVPHAGYQYSGSVAGYAYKQLTNKSFDTVIVIGISHFGVFDGITVIPSGEYETPLGRIKIDDETASRLLAADPKIFYAREPWDKEHSVDVQVPYLQKTLKNFKLVPVMIGQQSPENCRILADSILRSIKGKRVLVVASTDLSHYHTAEVAAKMDASAIDAISKGDLELLVSRLSSGECEMCGYGPVITAMMIAERQGANSYEILKYADTGDVTGDKSSVVGYLSAAIYKRPIDLDDTDRSTLLDIARRTLEIYINVREIPTVEVYQKNLLLRSGVFVTLKKDDQLRGCIGYIKPVRPLYLAVQDMTVAAATQDTRFTPVTTEELSSLNIEISVLSPMTRIGSTQEVIVGKHGLMITNGNAAGVLLPQVATENKWTRQQFLENICLKAGLSAEAISDSNTQLYTFTADVFHEL